MPPHASAWRASCARSRAAIDYRRRKSIVEPVFGQIKEAAGFRRFSLRGKDKVTAEWHLVCAVHDLGKLFRSGRAGRVIDGWDRTAGSDRGRKALGWA